jgi:hypothetical protein
MDLRNVIHPRLAFKRVWMATKLWTDVVAASVRVLCACMVRKNEALEDGGGENERQESQNLFPTL